MDTPYNRCYLFVICTIIILMPFIIYLLFFCATNAFLYQQLRNKHFMKLFNNEIFITISHIHTRQVYTILTILQYTHLFIFLIFSYLLVITLSHSNISNLGCQIPNDYYKENCMAIKNRLIIEPSCHATKISFT